MVISQHEQLSGHASRVRVLDRVFARLRDREDAIAQWIPPPATPPGQTATRPPSADFPAAATDSRQEYRAERASPCGQLGVAALAVRPCSSTRPMTRHPRSRVTGAQIARLSVDGERLCRAPTADH